MTTKNSHNETEFDDRNQGVGCEPITPFHSIEETAKEMLRSSTSRQRALLRLVATAHCCRIDPTHVLEGFASEQSASYRFQVRHLNEVMSGGWEFADATEVALGLATPASGLALRLAQEDGTLPELYSALRGRFPENEGATSEFDSHVPKVFGLLGRMIFIVSIFVFALLKIFPQHNKMHDEFGIECSGLMQQLIGIGAQLLSLVFVLPLAVLILLPFFVPAIKRYLIRWFPNAWRRPIPPHAVNQRKMMALIAESGQPIAKGIGILLEMLGIRRGAKALQKSNSRIEEGQDVWNSLAAQRVISKQEAKALTLSSDRETQTWLLRWSATQVWIRSSTRSGFLMHLFVALAHVFMGVLVLLVSLLFISSLVSALKSQM